MSSVVVTREKKPVFPDACVVCGRPGPGNFVRVKAAVTRRWLGVVSVIAGEWGADVPACGLCAGQICWQRQRRFLLALLCIVVGTLAAVSAVPAWVGWLQGTAMTGIVLVCMLPYFVYERFNPRPVSLEVNGLHATFDFRDPVFAEEFARLNEEARPDHGDSERGESLTEGTIGNTGH